VASILYPAVGALALAIAVPAAGQTVTPADLMSVDRAFNAMAQKEGLGKAFPAYAADSAVIMRQGNLMPVVGLAAIAEEYSKLAGLQLSWEPVKAEIAASQDLGYTYGSYKVRTGDAIRGHGVYVTIWKRQPDGSWKYVFDGGAQSPAEAPRP
jgi:ketosteroid isomerase-like protein